MGAAAGLTILTFLAGLVSFFAAIVITVGIFVQENKRLGRVGYILAFAAFIFVYTLIPSLVWPIRHELPDFWPPLQISFLFFYPLMGLVFLWRVRDAGWNSKLAYLYVVPVVNLVPFIWLLFLPTVITQEGAVASKARSLSSSGGNGSAVKRKWSPGRVILWGLGSYLTANLALFVLDPFSSPWHYHDHKPAPIPVIRVGDTNLSLSEITAILDEIDLAYGGREPTKSEQATQTIMQVGLIVFFPARVALTFKEFFGYMGPATREQQAFTLSVKKRYNYLARLAIANGMKRDGYFFLEEASLSKRNGASFQGSKLATEANSCDLERTARSTSAKVKTRLRFTNRSGETIKVFWLTYEGERKLYKILGPRKVYTQQTFMTHPWVVTNAGDVCVGLYFPSLEIKEVIIN